MNKYFRIAKVIIRNAELTDITRIDEIYNQVCDTRCATGDTKYLRNEDRLSWYNEHTPDTYPILAAESDSTIAG